VYAAGPVLDDQERRLGELHFDETANEAHGALVHNGCNTASMPTWMPGSGPWESALTMGLRPSEVRSTRAGARARDRQLTGG
jgi:hypothetical protein